MKICETGIDMPCEEIHVGSAAPEVLEENGDVRSLGNMLLELAEGKTAYACCNGEERKRRVCGEHSFLLRRKWSAEFVDFVKRCVENAPSAKKLMHVSECVRE